MNICTWVSICKCKTYLCASKVGSSMSVLIPFEALLASV